MFIKNIKLFKILFISIISLSTFFILLCYNLYVFISFILKPETPSILNLIISNMIVLMELITNLLILLIFIPEKLICCYKDKNIIFLNDPIEKKRRSVQTSLDDAFYYHSKLDTLGEIKDEYYNNENTTLLEEKPLYNNEEDEEIKFDNDASSILNTSSSSIQLKTPKKSKYHLDISESILTFNPETPVIENIIVHDIETPINNSINIKKKIIKFDTPKNNTFNEFDFSLSFDENSN
jgi:hypothetical protein